MDEPKRPRGRPATGRKRSKNISIRVTEEEYKKIQQNAEKNNTSITDYIIHIATK